MRIKLITLCMALCCLCLNAFAQNVPDYVPTEGLVAWYPFNGNANDESGNGNDGTVVGASATIDRDGNLNSALEFLGAPVPGTDRTEVAVDNHVAVPNFGEGFENGISISLWSEVYPTSESAFLQRRNNNNIDFSLELNNSQQPGVHLGFMALGSTSSIVNEWTHIALSYDEQTVQLFKNGMLIASEPSTQNINSYDDLLLIGKYIYYGGNTHHFFFNGKQDDIGIWNRALTEEEILALYNAELPIPGCTDSNACNFNPEATGDDGSCQENDNCGICGGDNSSCAGCMDPTACNYNPNALWSDGICIYPEIMWGTDSLCDDSLISAIVIVPELTGNQSALSFSSGNYVRIPLTESLANFPEAITVECWYYQLGFSGGDETIVGNEYYAGEGFSLENAHGTWNGFLSGSEGHGNWDYWDSDDSQMLLTNGSWSHIAMSYDGTVVRYFLDGELMDSNTENLGEVFSAGFSEDVVINRHTWGGGGSSSSRLTGFMDELRISNTARYQSEFTPLTIEFQNDEFTVGLYHFNESEGTVVVDASGYENHGQCNGTSWTENTIMVGLEESVEVLWDEVPGQDTLLLDFDATGSVTAEIFGDGFSCEVSSEIPSISLIFGCTESTGCNYDPEATCDDGSCTYPPFGLSDCIEGSSLCANGTVWNLETQNCGPLPCEFAVDGNACGPGTFWDETASQCLPVITCQEDLDGDGVIGINDLMQLLSSFGTMCEEPETAEFSCGDPVNYHGFDYATVQIDDQCWFAENLRTSFYLNGDSVAIVEGNSDWLALANDDSGAMAAYENTDENSSVFGFLYNGYAVLDNRKLCPLNWKVPSDSDWQDLELNLGMSTSELSSESWRGASENIGTRLKVDAANSPSWNGSNTTLWSGLPAGYRHPEGGYNSLGSITLFWSQGLVDGANPLYDYLFARQLKTTQAGIKREREMALRGFSIRCLKDTE